MEFEVFRWERRVGFGDCDPAQIAYSGRILDFALEAIDAFWEARLDGCGWFGMTVDHGIGTPFVRMECDFFAPVTPRHSLLCEVAPVALGQTSITFEVTGSQLGRPCFRARMVNVFIEAAEFRKTPIPDWIREKLVASQIT